MTLIGQCNPIPIRSCPQNPRLRTICNMLKTIRNVLNSREVSKNIVSQLPVGSEAWPVFCLLISQTNLSSAKHFVTKSNTRGILDSLHIVCSQETFVPAIISFFQNFRWFEETEEVRFALICRFHFVASIVKANRSQLCLVNCQDHCCWQLWYCAYSNCLTSLRLLLQLSSTE